MERLSHIMRTAQESSHPTAQQRAPQQPAIQGPQSPTRRLPPEQNGRPGASVRSSGVYRSRSALPLRISETRQDTWDDAERPSIHPRRTSYGSPRSSSPLAQNTRYSEEPPPGDYYEEREHLATLPTDAREEWGDDTGGMRYGDWENAPAYTRVSDYPEDDGTRSPIPHPQDPVTRPPSQECNAVPQRPGLPHGRDSHLAMRERYRAGSKQAYAATPREGHLPAGRSLPQRTTQPLKPQQITRLPAEMQRRTPHTQQPVLPETPPSTGADYTITVNSAANICPHCKGAGFLRNNVPFGHPQFGKAIACQCKEQERKRKRRQQLQEISNLGAFNTKRFETFNPRVPGMQEAFQISLEFSRGPNGWLLLIGPNGCGKTHLAAAIANECLETGAVVLFATVPDLLDHLRAAFAPDSSEIYDQLFARMREAEVLVLDDLGVQQSSPWANEKLFQLFNYRYNSGFPTVITANSRGLQATDERIRSRLSDIALVTILNLDRARDYRPNNPHRG
jgi:DNA replication protein DnaC